MSNNSTDSRKNPWVVFNYEVFMLIYTLYLKKISEQKTQTNIDRALNFALVESRLLHMRILVDIFLSKSKSEDDISIDEIINPCIQTEYFKNLIKNLNSAYGSRKIEYSPCWTLNKMLVHPSNLRDEAYDYKVVFDKIFPIIYDLLKEVYSISQNEELKMHLVFTQNNLFA